MPVYCITGTDRGIGLEFVRQLAASSQNTVLALVKDFSLDLAGLKTVASPETHIVACDVGDQNSIQAFVQKAHGILSDKKIGFLINNAAIHVRPPQTSLSLGEDLYEQMRINVMGPAKMVEFLLAADLLADDVRVVNESTRIASMQEMRGFNTGWRWSTGYCISKAGLNMLTLHQSENLKEHLQHPIIIVLDPGWVKTESGGPWADIEPEDSVRRMLDTIHRLKEEDNARFMTWTGENVPW